MAFPISTKCCRVAAVDVVLWVLAKMQGDHQLLARPLYGTGLCTIEALWASPSSPDALPSPLSAAAFQIEPG